MATRVYWAISALGVAPDGSTSATQSEFVSGIQSVGITTTFNLEQVFQLGQLSLYQDVEEVPDVEVTVERVLDGFDCMYTRVMGTGTISENQDVKKDIYFNVYSDANNEVGDGNPEAGVVAVSQVDVLKRFKAYVFGLRSNNSPTPPPGWNVARDSENLKNVSALLTTSINPLDFL